MPVHVEEPREHTLAAQIHDAVRAGLDAVAAARKANGDSRLHHELAHAGYVEQSDIPRFAELDVIPDFSPIIQFPSPIIASVIKAVGPCGKHYWPTRSLLEAGARALKMESQIGSIETGKSGQIIVLDRNPFKVNSDDISDTRVRTTFFEGRLVSGKAQ